MKERSILCGLAKFNQIPNTSTHSATNIDSQWFAMGDLKSQAKEIGESVRVPVPNTRVPFVGHVNSLALKKLICGSIAGGVSGVAAAPFEFLRSKAVAGKGGGSVREVLSDAIRQEGLGFIKKGSFISSIMRTSLQRGILFVTYEAVKRWEEKKVGKDVKWLPALPRDVSVATVAGAAAAFTSTLLTYPMNTVGDRMFLKIGWEHLPMFYRAIEPPSWILRLHCPACEHSSCLAQIVLHMGTYILVSRHLAAKEFLLIWILQVDRNS